MTEQFTSLQRMALKVMAEDNVGAVVTKFGWTWPQGVRESEEKAIAVLAALRPARCNMEAGQEYKEL